MIRSPIAVAFLTIFLDLVGFGLILPIQPFFAESFGASPTQVAGLAAAYSMMQFLFAPFWGRLSDRIGRRPIMLMSIAVSAVGHLIFGLATSLPLLFAARLLAGLGTANIAAAQAIIADSTPPQDRARGMGIIGAAFGLGFILGPALGGALAGYGLAVPSLAAALLSVMNLVFAWFCLPETLKAGAPAIGRRKVFPYSEILRAAALDSNVGVLFTMTGFVVIGFSLMEVVIGLLIERSFIVAHAHADSARLTAYFLVAVGFSSAFVQGGLIGPLTRKFGELTLIHTGSGTLAIALALIPVSASTGIFIYLILSGMLLALGTGLMNPSANSLLSRSAGESEQGMILGFNQSIGALGRVIGPAIAGPLFQMNPHYPFWLGSTLISLGFLLSFRLKPPRSRSKR